MTKLQIIAEWYSFIVFAVSFVGVIATLKKTKRIGFDWIAIVMVTIGFLLYLNIFLSRWFG